MLKVMLVDDDAPMLRYLNKLIPWQELGLEIAATARSGTKALELFAETRPHLVVADIGMPRMDGLELAGRLRELVPEVRIIFLTCHEDFAYARAAVQLGADDYLIKDELTAEALRTSVDKAIRLIRLAQERAVQSAYREEVTRNREVLKRSFWSRVVSGDLSEASLEAGRHLGIEWREPDFMLGIVRVDQASIMSQYGQKDAPLLRYGVYNIAQELAQSPEPGRITVIADEGRDLICVMNYRRNLAFNAKAAFREFAEALVRMAGDYLKVSLRATLGAEFRSARELGARYGELRRHEESLYYDGDDGAAGRSGGAEAGGASAALLRSDVREAFLAACRERDEAGLFGIMDAYAARCRAERTPPAAVVAQYSRWVRLLEYEAGCEEDHALFQADLARTGRLEETLGSAKAHMRAILAAGGRDEAADDASAGLRRSVIDRYIKDRLSESISLVSAANHLYMNPSYFSRYFKKLTGVNFTDYVNRYKMDIAKQWMKNRELTVEMISDQLGYSDRTYFSKVFKKYNGASPAEYKSNLGK